MPGKKVLALVFVYSASLILHSAPGHYRRDDAGQVNRVRWDQRQPLSELYIFVHPLAKRKLLNLEFIPIGGLGLYRECQ